MRARFASSVALLACAVPAIAGTPTYTIDDIGALDDLTDTVPSPPTA